MKRVFLLLSAAAFMWVNAFGQSRVEESFNADWQFYKAQNRTFFTSFENGQSYKEAEGQWTVPEVWEKVDLPHTFNRDDMQRDRNFFEGKAVYQKKFFAAANQQGRRTFLKFEGVGAVAQLYINQQYIGEHKGAYSMFVFEISNSIDYAKENILTVITDNQSRKDVLPTDQFLFPVYGGIYRPVALITTAKTGFVVTDDASPGVFIRQQEVSEKSATVKVLAKLETKEKVAQQVELIAEVYDDQGKVVQHSRKPVLVTPQGSLHVETTLSIDNPHLWDGVRDPYLYKLRTRLMKGDLELDCTEQPLGLRTIELVAGDGVFLNGKRYPMYGVARHQDRWGFGSAFSFAQHKEDFMLMKEMGVTTVRLAHYQQASATYSLADSLGFLVWAEIPFVNRVSFTESYNAKQQLRELVKQQYNHPSIYIWGVHNEVYSKTADGLVPVLSRELHDLAKTLDPDRLTGAVTGYSQIDRQENLTTDVQGINHYFGWYGGEIGDLKPWAEKAQRDFPSYRIILSEYGADGNMDIGQEKVVKPKNVVTGDYFPENYQTETHIQQWAAIEKNPIIIASYVWNMFEFAVPAWNRGGVNARNLKGLITFDRQRRKDSFYWYKANWNPEPMLYLANRRDNEREEAVTRIQLFSNQPKVSIAVNGERYEAKQGVNSKHWVVEQVKLRKGVNIIKATSTDGEKSLTDEMTWTLK
ncbi:glycoside hydrolase family 2 protein [Sphingobacterium sp. MYb382]|uniref:glycoside hydrolase family 2 protein n=1 Tax=Sphingobacterium sp. MYb382 TaxID=2745278 RepID=UPI00309BF866